MNLKLLYLPNDRGRPPADSGITQQMKASARVQVTEARGKIGISLGIDVAGPGMDRLSALCSLKMTPNEAHALAAQLRATAAEAERIQARDDAEP